MGARTSSERACGPGWGDRSTVDLCSVPTAWGEVRLNPRVNRMADDLIWSVLDGDSVDELRTLAQACLDADGGLPLFTGEEMLRRRMLIGESIAARDGSGALAAAAAVSVDGAGAITTGMVHPARRGEGLGGRLLQWARDRAGHAPLTVATETLSERAERLYARFGPLRCSPRT